MSGRFGYGDRHSATEHQVPWDVTGHPHGSPPSGRAWGDMPVAIGVDVTGPNSIVVRPSGEIDYSSLAPLRDALLDARIAGVSEIIVDLVDVTFCDSQGLAVILYAHQRQRSAGGQLFLRNCSDHVTRLLAITNLQEVLVEAPPVSPA